MTRRLILTITFAMVLIIAGCSKQGGDTTEEQAVVPVETAVVDYGEVIQSLSFDGDIKAEVEVKVFAKIPDRIVSLAVDEGDYVRKGDLIASILATTLEQAARQAEAAKNNMEAEYARAQRLRQENAMSQQQFDNIQTQVTQARAAYTSAQSTLDDAQVTAPISGIIGKRYYEAGDMATPAMPLVSIVQMNNVKMVLDATEEDLGKLAVGQKAEISVRSFPDEVFTGKVWKISPVLDAVTRLATVEILIPNPNLKLKPGMYSRAVITTGVLEHVLVVPRYSVIESTSMIQENGEDKVVKNYFVYVVNDSNKAEQRKLDVTYINHKRIALKAGVNPGEQVVIAGQKNLRDGLPVMISEEKEAE